MKLTLKKFTIYLTVIMMIFTTAVAVMPEKQAQAAQETYEGQIWKIASVKLRKTAKENGKTICKIKKGKTVQVYYTSGSWRKVSYNGKIGWIKKKYVFIKTNAPSVANMDTATKGATVAAFAQRFVGNPYVWGGTNLNSGADCSGFVGAVYKRFGYNLPRSSSSLRTAGKKVSANNMQPGDLVCYSGHVAMYIGNGKIVHASSKKTGIKISDNYRYRSVVAIRRIVK
ncbi:MAG: C40 family peptidase [Anaerostipes sp.]|nr:C40 family peptidase [Anaerostipes sp.]